MTGYEWHRGRLSAKTQDLKQLVWMYPGNAIIVRS